MVEQLNMMEEWTSDGETMEHLMVEQWNTDG